MASFNSLVLPSLVSEKTAIQKNSFFQNEKKTEELSLWMVVRRQEEKGGGLGEGEETGCRERKVTFFTLVERAPENIYLPFTSE